MPNQSDMKEEEIYFEGCQNNSFDVKTRFTMEAQVNNNPVDYLELFKAIAMKIVDKKGEIYYHVPYYVKATENEEIFELFTYEQLPDYVKEDLLDSLPKAVTPIGSKGNYVDVSVIREEVKRIKALGLNTTDLLDYFIKSIENQTFTVEPQ